MKSEKTRKIVLAAMFAAIVCVLTFLVKIPTPTKGYVNLGDCAVNVAGWFLGPVYGGLAAGIGSAMTDLISGYMTYVPGTFIIKGIMAVESYFVFRLLSAKGNSFAARIISAAGAELIMVLGYFLYESILYSSFAAAVPGIPGNIVQGIMGVAGAVLIQEAVMKRVPQTAL